jgi:ferredoxin
VPKTVKLTPINQETLIQTNENILSALLQEELQVMKECGGRGMCSTCHVYVTEGMDSLSPLSRREKRTLETITSCKNNSRLACQARVIGEGVVLELPSGMYVSAITDIETLIGRRAEQNILHPLDGRVLVETGKLITRSTVNLLKEAQAKSTEYLSHTTEA